MTQTVVSLANKAHAGHEAYLAENIRLKTLVLDELVRLEREIQIRDRKFQSLELEHAALSSELVASKEEAQRLKAELQLVTENFSNTKQQHDALLLLLQDLEMRKASELAALDARIVELSLAATVRDAAYDDLSRRYVQASRSLKIHLAKKAKTTAKRALVQYPTLLGLFVRALRAI